MTTASRPTFDPARGGQGRGEKDLSSISRQYSSRDLPSHTKLKYRQHGQGTIDEYRTRDFQRELEEREHDRKGGQQTYHLGDMGQRAPMSNEQAKKLKLEAAPSIPSNLDADDANNNDDDESDNSDSDDDGSVLQAELIRIQKERAIEQARKDAEKKQEEERIRMENILSGNPLLTHYSSGSNKSDQRVKRRWDDDVVFKNCARSEPEKKPNVFINDSLRSEFHKKFMEKYIK